MSLAAGFCHDRMAEVGFSQARWRSEVELTEIPNFGARQCEGSFARQIVTGSYDEVVERVG
jgi:hypothetical protein